MFGQFDFWRLLAGLGIFLFGMLLIEESVRSLSKKTFRRIIRMYTDGRFRAIGSGTLITALLQSSSAVSLMVLAFVGAGILSMESAIGVIMGSNIGTTLTAWIIAAVGFKIKIESFALPFIGIGAVGLILFRPSSKLFQFTRLIIGFGFLFLGLDYMKSSVDTFAGNFDISRMPSYGMWVYLLIGVLITAIMQASAATLAIVLSALNSQLITFDIGAVMVIGANVGTTITVLLGAIGGIPAKKKVALSHLAFNVVTGLVAVIALPGLVWTVNLFVDINGNSLMGLAFFHTLFNILGVAIFLPFIGLLALMLGKLFPEHKAVLSVYINKTSAEVTDAATAALKKEVSHLLQECQLYNLRMLDIDEQLVFEQKTPFENNKKKNYSLEELYTNIKLLHAEIYTYYSMLLSHQLEQTEARDLERAIYASRNIMNSTKNFKSIKENLDEFDCSENEYMNTQYQALRKRLIEGYHEMNRIIHMDENEERFRRLVDAFMHIEETDNLFIEKTLKAVSEKRIREMEISSLILVNRLFTQACRMQIYSIKDLHLNPDQINRFEKVMENSTPAKETTCLTQQPASP